MKLVLIILCFLATSCGVATNEAELGSVENYASGRIVNDLQCGLKNSLKSDGRFNEKMIALVPASNVVKFDKAIPKQKQEQYYAQIQSALTSVPKELQQFLGMVN